jgi:hypothetical protein
MRPIFAPNITLPHLSHLPQFAKHSKSSANSGSGWPQKFPSLRCINLSILSGICLLQVVFCPIVPSRQGRTRGKGPTGQDKMVTGQQTDTVPLPGSVYLFDQLHQNYCTLSPQENRLPFVTKNSSLSQKYAHLGNQVSFNRHLSMLTAQFTSRPTSHYFTQYVL